MVTVNAASLSTLVADTTITAATSEVIIDHAINKINEKGYVVSNLTGAAGSKTGTYTSAEAVAS